MKAPSLATELAVLTLATVALTFAFRAIYPMIGLPATGPAPVRTVVLVLVATLFIRSSGRRWRDYGMVHRLRWWQLVLAVLALFAVKLLVVQRLSDTLRTALQLAETDYSFFQHLAGNAAALAAWLVTAWVAGAFAEEMLLRGYLMGRIAETAGGTQAGWALALIAQAAVFGAGHAYGGAASVISSTLTALVFGGAVLLSRRSLWPAIIVHGLWDSLGFLVLYQQPTPTAG